MEKITRFQSLVLVIAITSITSIIALWTIGYQGAIIVGILNAIIIWISRRIWMPDGYVNGMVKRYSLFVILTVALSFSYWDGLFNSFITSPLLAFVQNNFDFLDGVTIPHGPTIDILIFVLGGVWIVNYLNRDNTGMGISKTQINDDEFPEKENYIDRLVGFSNTLQININRINKDTSWSEEFFTPLEAEVEIKTKNKVKKRITDLLTAIKRDKKTKVFLVLGDPGSGKSVALRKLCSDLNKEVKKTKKVPIYIDLREWEINHKWSRKNKPTTTQLYDFIIENIVQKGDNFTEGFVETHFEKMYKHGRIFFILDSFDEIPSVLDVDHDSWLIDELSHVIYTFLGGAQDSRGILSCRFFRKPTSNFDAKATLEIRPFSEKKIIERFEKSFKFNPELHKILFKEKIEFIPVARNPFTASLLLFYFEKSKGKFPDTQAELYSHYIDASITKKRKSKNQDKHPHSIEYLKNAMTEIAYLMFEKTEFGLEIPIDDLKKELSDYPIDEIVKILRKARLIRVGYADDKLFSFVHRRFNEYFVAQKLIKNEHLIPKDSIPTDSRWRDALVLYCEIAEEKKAIEIAEYCWSEIKKVRDLKLNLRDKRYRRAIHCLRFLNDAFRSKKKLIDPFYEDLSIFIHNQISYQNLLETKLVVESVGLLKEEAAELTLIKALKLNDPWIRETAIRSCRHLPKISKELEVSVMNHINTIDSIELFKRRKELLFGFSLSDGFKKVLNRCKLKIFDIWLLVGCVFLLFFISPISVILFLIIFSFFRELGLYMLESIRLNSVKKSIIEKNKKTEKKEKPISPIIKLFDKIDSSIEIKDDKNQPPIEMFNLLPFFRIYVHSITAVLVLSVGFKYSIENNYLNNIFQFSISPFFNSSWIRILVITLITISCLIPIYEIGKMLPKFSRLFKIPIKGLLVFIFSVGVLFTTIIGLMVLIGLGIVELIEISPFIISTVIIVLSILLVSYFLIQLLYVRIKDHLFLKNLVLKNTLNREEIQRMLEQLKTKKGRANFIKMIDTRSIQIRGNWKNNEIPYAGEKAYTLIAKMEERLLGFER